MSNLTEITVPDIGDFDEVDVIEVLVAEGDVVTAEQSLITVESDKASMEIPSSEAGTVKSVKVSVGDKVKQGSVIVELQADAEAPDKKPAAASPAPAKPESAASSATATQKSEATSSTASDSQETVAIAIPDIGDFNEVEVIEVLVSVGDTVEPEQSLITVESDKASMEIPSPQGGTVQAVNVQVGDKVSQGTDFIQLSVVQAKSAKPEAAGQTPAAPTKAEPDTVTAQPDAATPMASEPVQRKSPTADYKSDATLGKLPHASPSVRKFARELGVDLRQVNGTAPKGRITFDDVRNYVKGKVAQSGSAVAKGGDGLSVLDWPKIDFTKFGEIESRPLSRIQKIAGANLHRNWVMIPHVTNNDQADITDLEALRVTLNKEKQKEGIKVTMLGFLIKAVVAALKKFPEFNASLDGDNLILKQYYHIGFAADTPHGLVVPVIRDADKKGVFELAAEMGELAGLARDGKLSPAQMQGGCFTISSLGGIGGTDFTPIINAPEVAILGVSRSAQMPVWDGQSFIPRLMLPLSLSYDHRVIDGAAAARFNAYLASLLADFRRIAL